ncbi:STAS domain-containing protein [Jiella sp. MQZ9-1]|uniref:STAS domain-containing protein n=1 Tax=Jiella flava TaxID=2816857 RepID=A0A939FZA6_9HYPH|nr:STAS domain-containing protein [Jiella flava]MBO0664335.1 STAS domain-containing protein [Jiella flava]MCD2472971.1 STAS domain-containing protein [Jiella flava]
MPRKSNKATSVEGTIFALPQVLDLKAATPLTEKLMALRGQDLVIDASKVERLGTQCVQILISAAATWKDEMAAFTIAEPSDAFTSGLQVLGLTPQAIIEKEVAQ